MEVGQTDGVGCTQMKEPRIPNKLSEEEMSIWQKEWIISGGLVRPIGKYLGGEAIAFTHQSDDDGDWYCESRMYVHVGDTWTKVPSNPEDACSKTCNEMCEGWVKKRGLTG